MALFLKAAPPPVEYRLLATSKTSTLEKELNEAARPDFAFRQSWEATRQSVARKLWRSFPEPIAAKGRYSYKLMATSKTSTMEKEMQEAADAGFEYKDQTVFDSAFGGKEVVVIMERDKESSSPRSQTSCSATAKTSTLEKELLEVGEAGYAIVGMTVAKTAMGGKELVAITKRDKQGS